MPTIRRRTKRRIQATWADLSICDLMFLNYGTTRRECMANCCLHSVDDIREFCESVEWNFSGPHESGAIVLGTRPWGWWEFVSTTKRDAAMSETEQLRLLGELTEWEIGQLAKRAAMATPNN